MSVQKNKDVFILGDVEEVTSKLEVRHTRGHTSRDTHFTIVHTYTAHDHTITHNHTIIHNTQDNQVALQGMLANRFIAPLQAEVEQWDQKLAALDDVLEAWYAC